MAVFTTQLAWLLDKMKRRRTGKFKRTIITLWFIRHLANLTPYAAGDGCVPYAKAKRRRSHLGKMD